MAQIFLLLTIFVMTVVSGFAQTKTADYSGKWTLDVSASKLDERSRVESMTMTVTQNAKEITVETETKRAAPPEGSGQGRTRRRYGTRRRPGRRRQQTYLLA